MGSLHDLRMKESSGTKSSISDEDFNEFLKQIAKKGKEKYKFILKAGKIYYTKEKAGKMISTHRGLYI